MTTNRVGLEIHEEAWSKCCAIIQRELRELRVILEGEICRIDIRPESLTIEAEVLAPDQTWEHTNTYNRRFTY